MSFNLGNVYQKVKLRDRFREHLPYRVGWLLLLLVATLAALAFGGFWLFRLSE